MVNIRNTNNYAEPKSTKRRRLTSEHIKENNIKMYINDIEHETLIVFIYLRTGSSRGFL
jgi:hypothetical protein